MHGRCGRGVQGEGSSEDVQWLRDHSPAKAISYALLIGTSGQIYSVIAIAVAPICSLIPSHPQLCTWRRGTPSTIWGGGPLKFTIRGG